MRQSELFVKTRKESPQGETSLNAKLLIRGGYVSKQLAGVYAYLPLGLMVINKISAIVREEMNNLGAIEMSLTALQSKDIWEKTDRWDDRIVDVWFKTKLKNNTELGLGFTHEEALVNLLKEHIYSYKDLPRYIYQIQTKFRNELRAKSGIMRGREFLMKDLYSFNSSLAEQDLFYERVKATYQRIFTRCGLGGITYLTFASGGTFSKYSHEFQTISAAGEDTIYLDESTGLAVNKEVFNDEVIKDLNLIKSKLVMKKSIEVGNIFKQGVRFTEALNLHYLDERGHKQPVYLGAYGIGISRIMGAIVETFNDDRGISWPKNISPFQVHLICLGDDQSLLKRGEVIYDNLAKQGYEVLFDDRQESPGIKLGDSDLLGIPIRLVLSKKNGEMIEWKFRSEEKMTLLADKQLKDKLKSFYV